MAMTNCPRCGGQGCLPEIDGPGFDTCYACCGTGRVPEEAVKDMEDSYREVSAKLAAERRYAHLAETDGLWDDEPYSYDPEENFEGVAIYSATEDLAITDEVSPSPDYSRPPF